jgi:hypothetical protein
MTPRERDLILRGLFELTITYAEDDQTRHQAKALAAKLGGDPEAMFYGATPRACTNITRPDRQR